ncbi:Glycosyl transferase, group 1 [Candidatus Sulfopaludibacter sp. SbA3]|nr:Glycosyl transferase, group 1 [Candidatus Sulfopaludibacter sp. SbA3]
MRIALLGTRGIPASYGGFETFAEELSVRLVERGHQVTVYCRERHSAPIWRGVRLQYLPTIRHKYFDTLAHTWLSTLHLLEHRADAALYCNGANAIFTLLPRISRIPVALNVDGIERRRKKWNRLAKAWYFASEWLATFCPSIVVTDARTIQDYYREQWGKDSVFISYGAAIGRVPGTSVLEKLGLAPNGYFLYVSRMEPENHPLEVRQAFEKLATPMKLALIGDAPYAQEYIRRVRDTADPRILMPGAIYGEGYHELQSHSFAYIHATEVGGTHPALIEAMGRGALVLYRDTPENAEVTGDAGIPFDSRDLPAKLASVVAMSEESRAELRRRAMDRARERYSWDAVTTAYERLLGSL